MTCRSCRIPDSETIMPLPLGVDPRFTDRERQPGLDLLRALAIIVVVIYHAALFGFKLPSRIDRFGWIGVDLFFVLSGYLIGGQLLAPLARGNELVLAGFSRGAYCASCRRISSFSRFTFCCRHGASIQTCPSRCGNFSSPSKILPSTAARHSRTHGRSRWKTNFTWGFPSF